MAKEVREKKQAGYPSRILHAAAKLFLEKGFRETKMAEIAALAGVSYGALFRTFDSKEEILSELVALVLEAQFETAEQLVAGKTEDRILLYAAETTLQLYMAESSEHMREMYNVSYSLPKSASVVYRTLTNKLEYVFGEHLPHLETKDFYELEIASGGIMRSYVTVPCDIYFTMERKVRRFLETTFLVYRVSDEKIEEAVAFVSRFDYPTIAKKTIDSLLTYLESNV